MKLRSQGGIKALLGIVRCEHPDVLLQVARGIANFAKCESRASSQGLVSCQYLIVNGEAVILEECEAIENGNSCCLTFAGPFCF